MQKNVIIVVLISVIFQCNGHLPSLTGILSGAHKHVHHTVQGVANTVLGGFSFDGHVQVGSQSRPQPPKTEQPETVIVIVDESPDNNYGPGPQNQPNQEYGQYDNYNNRPHRPHGQNNYGHGRPWQNQNGNYNNANSNGPYQNHHNNYGQNPYNNGNHDGYGHNQNENKFPQANENDYNRPEQTTQGYGNPNNGYNNRPLDQVHQNNGNTNQNNYGQTQSPPPAEARPTFASNHENDRPTQKPYQNNKSTTESDVPQFVPLNPNEYVYGGEKINVTSPKRETDSHKPASDNDDEFPIDIRFQDN